MAVWTLTLVNKEDSSGEEKVNEQQILAADFPSPFLSHLSDNPSAKLSNSLGDHDIKSTPGTSLLVQWLRLHTSTARGVGASPVRN